MEMNTLIVLAFLGILLLIAILIVLVISCLILKSIHKQKENE